MKTKYFGNILKGHVYYMIGIFFYSFVVGQWISLIEFESKLQQVIGKPNISKSAKQSLVEIIRYSPTILNLEIHKEIYQFVKISLRLTSPNMKQIVLQEIPLL